MKKFLLKTLDITLTVIMILSALYAVFNMTMAFLPVEIQTQVLVGYICHLNILLHFRFHLQ